MGCNALKTIMKSGGMGEGGLYYQVAIAKAHDSLPGCHWIKLKKKIGGGGVP